MFKYDNDTVVIYPFVSSDTYDKDLYLHVENGVTLKNISIGYEMSPLYKEGSESIFRIRTHVGRFDCYKITR